MTILHTCGKAFITLQQMGLLKKKTSCHLAGHDMANLNFISSPCVKVCRTDGCQKKYPLDINGLYYFPIYPIVKTYLSFKNLFIKNSIKCYPISVNRSMWMLQRFLHNCLLRATIVAFGVKGLINPLALGNSKKQNQEIWYFLKSCLSALQLW